MDLTWTNTWLAILAVISLIQFLIVCAAGLLAYRMYQKAMTTIETVERVHIAPLRARVDGMLDQVQVMTDKVRHVQESVSDALRHVTGTGSAVAGAVKSKTWPIVGIIQGLKSVANSVMGNGRRRPRRATGPTALCKVLLHRSFRRLTRKISHFLPVRALQYKRSTGFLSGFLRLAPLQCAEQPQAREAPAGASSRHSTLISTRSAVNGDGRRAEELG